jgi:hypothetical protein
MTTTVLREWGRRHHHRQPLASYLGRPRALLPALYHRWPNAIEATSIVGATLDQRPRLPYQLVACAVRLMDALAKWRHSTSWRASA